MPNWMSSMIQTFEYYIVDPITWKDVKMIRTVKSSVINRDSTVETLGSATIDVTESTGECYIRIYLITIQNGVRERHPLGTYLVQTPSTSFNGKITNITMDAYTPLIELKESPPPIGYYVPKNSNVMQKAKELTTDHLRAPVVGASNDSNLFTDFLAESSDTWLSYISGLISNAEYYFDIDEMGRILYSPIQETASLQPVWTYSDDNSSILYPEIDINHDMYGIPNVVEVLYSTSNDNYYARVENNDSNSPISIKNRGREIVKRVTNPNMIGNPTENQIEKYAKQLLMNLSTLEYTITYTHGYCPVRVGDCVRLNYERAGIKNVKAKVISQSIKCVPGCPVTEKAVFTNKLWG